jgi:hypothetical protein
MGVDRHAHPTRLEQFTQHSTPLHGLSTLHASLPALEDLITLTPCRSSSKIVSPRLTRDIRRDILLLRELSDYENEVEYMYECIAKLLSK